MLLCLVGGGVPHPRVVLGYPSQVLMVGVPHPRSGVPQSGLDGGGTPSQGGGYPSQVLMVGVPHPRSGVPRSGLDGGGTPSQGGRYPSLVLMVGVPYPRVGGPQPGLDGGGYPRYPRYPPPSRPSLGVVPHPRSGWYPIPGWGYPSQVLMVGVPHPGGTLARS